MWQQRKESGLANLEFCVVVFVCHEVVCVRVGNPNMNSRFCVVFRTIVGSAEISCDRFTGSGKFEITLKCTKESADVNFVILQSFCPIE